MDGKGHQARSTSEAWASRADALTTAVAHVAGKSRAFLLELRSFEREVCLLAREDERASALLAALAAATVSDGAAGTLPQVERAATALLQGLTGADTQGNGGKHG